MATFTTEKMIAIGGSRWTKGDHDRVYINDWAHFAGLETSHYNTGNISYATWQGEKISNSQAYKLAGSIDKVWFDATDGKLHCRYGYSESRVATRDEVWDAIVSGIREAITPELNTRQAAEQLGVSVRTVQRWAKLGKLTGRKDQRGRWIITL